VNDEQRPRGSAAALDSVALADPPASRPQPGTPGHVNEGAAPASSIAQRTLAWTREFIQFGLVGATAFIVDMGLFNLLQHGPLGVLAGHPNAAQFIAAATATLYSWIANRLWTYRGRTQDNATREAILFFVANICGIAISQFCLLFTHYILGFTSALADNIAVYVVGFVLGTAFRFFFYHYVVFTGRTRA